MHVAGHTAAHLHPKGANPFGPGVPGNPFSPGHVDRHVSPVGNPFGPGVASSPFSSAGGSPNLSPAVSPTVSPRLGPLSHPVIPRIRSPSTSDLANPEGLPLPVIPTAQREASPSRSPLQPPSSCLIEPPSLLSSAPQ
eukprot:TRINITY_DN8974_c0_g1_i1.p2 TRINITY_DN8974_c0_g1~~TRINITY_DN8974_c0_g1_i1.p2  ORF type:complete len:148 (+),score=14.63 TRINITY_DN8974_c0_g1_i1:33-446(+)